MKVNKPRIESKQIQVFTKVRHLKKVDEPEIICNVNFLKKNKFYLASLIIELLMQQVQICVETKIRKYLLLELYQTWCFYLRRNTKRDVL